MKTIKARHKLVPAIIMLIVAAITMSTASYAWFTMSNRVEVTGINLEVVAPTNILIRQGGTSNAFANAVSVSTLNPTGKLSHASSTDGISMITVEDAINGVDVDGYLITGTTLVATTTQVAGTDGFFLDYPLELVNTGGNDVQVGLDNLSISPVASSAAGTTILNAVRFAILNESKEISFGVFSIDGHDITDAYQGDAVTTSIQTTETTKANMFVLQSDGVADTTAPEEAVTVVVRVWIEGQDPDCVSLNAGSKFAISFNLYVSDEASEGENF